MKVNKRNLDNFSQERSNFFHEILELVKFKRRKKPGLLQKPGAQLAQTVKPENG